MIIYLIRNTVNGKGYVGQTIRTLEERWAQHKSQGIGRYKNDALHNALLKYGIEAFEIAVLDSSAKTLDELNELEKFHIKAQGTLSPGGYNLTTGGFSYKRSPETLAKMSMAMKGKKPSAETIAKIVAKHIGRKHSAQTKAKLSIAKIGNQYTKGRRHTKESIEKMSAAAKGRSFSEETRKKMSLAKKGKPRAPRRNQAELEKSIHAVA
jgi:group I intron endonuclease